MTVATLALVAAVAAVLVLAFLVVSLHRRVQGLSAEVRVLSDAVERTTSQPAARPPAEVPPAAVPPAEGTVAVITDLPSVGQAGPPALAGPGRVVSVTLAGPMIKVAALSHGLRRALSEEQRMRIGYAFRRELRRQRRLRRRAAATRPRQPEGWRP